MRQNETPAEPTAEDEREFSFALPVPYPTESDLERAYHATLVDPDSLADAIARVFARNGIAPRAA